MLADMKDGPKSQSIGKQHVSVPVPPQGTSEHGEHLPLQGGFWGETITT